MLIAADLGSKVETEIQMPSKLGTLEVRLKTACGPFEGPLRPGPNYMSRELSVYSFQNF